MGSLNKVILIGNLGRDAELKYTPGGAAVANLSIATTEKWKNKDGEPQEKTEWHRCQLWGKIAENLTEYLTKGKQVYVEGKIQTRKYEKDGVDHYATEIRVDHVVLLGGGGGSGGARPARPDAARGSDDHSGPVTDDDIPF